MRTLSFPTIKLGEHIKQIKLKVKDTELKQAGLTVYGVTNTEGVSITNNKASDDLGNYIVLNEHQFAYNPYRINVGSIGLTQKGTFGVVSPAYVVFEADEHIDSEFLLYYLKSSIGINLIKWYGDRGGVRAALRYSDLAKIDFPNISLEKQLSILSKIKKLESKVKLIIDKTGIGDIEKLRQSILQQAIKGNLCEQNPDDEVASVLLEKIKKEKDILVEEGKIKKQKDLPPVSDEEKPFELPDGWEWCRFGFLTSKIGAGSTPTGGRNVYLEQGIKFIRSQNVYNSGLILDDIAYISSEMNNKMSGSVVKPNDILLNITGGSIGRCALVPVDFDIGNVNQHVLIIRTIDTRLNQYLHYALTSKLIQDEIMKQQVGASREGLSALKTTNFIVPIPPLQEQRRIVEKVDELMILCDKLESEVNKAQQYASQLMESVLQEAFTTDEQAMEEQSNQNSKVIPIRPKQKAEVRFAMAARGNIKQSTLESLQKRAIEIANGEK